MARELTDAEVFGTAAQSGPRELSDAEVFGAAPPPTPIDISSNPAKAMQQEAQSKGWLERNLGGIGTAPLNLMERARQVLNPSDPNLAAGAMGDSFQTQPAQGSNLPQPSPQGADNVQMLRSLEQEAPVGAFAGNVGMMAGLPAAQTVKGAAAIGGAMGALQPTMEDETTAGNVGKGAAFGGAGGMLARMISPNVRPGIQKLMDEGITPTPGQIMGGMAQRMEEKLRSVPILGDAITSTHQKQVEDLNRAIYRRALEPIGGDVPETVGREGVKSVRNQLSDAYEKLLPQVTFTPDRTFRGQMAAIRAEAQNLPAEQARQFDILVDRLPDVPVSGKVLQTPLSKIKTDARGLATDGNIYNRKLADLLKSAQGAVRQTLARVNPDHEAELNAIDTGFANYARIREAAGRVGAKEGVVSPAQFSNVVQTMDKGAGRGRAAAGESFMQDLSDPAKSILSQTVPDSGTAGRLFAGLLAGKMAGADIGGAAGTAGAAFMEPHTLTALGIGSLPYLPGGRQLAAALMARRPDLAKPVGKAVMLGAPGAGAMAPALFGPQE